jgi:hypothetical protein
MGISQGRDLQCCQPHRCRRRRNLTVQSQQLPQTVRTPSTQRVGSLRNLEHLSVQLQGNHNPLRLRKSPVARQDIQMMIYTPALRLAHERETAPVQIREAIHPLPYTERPRYQAFVRTKVWAMFSVRQGWLKYRHCQRATLLTVNCESYQSR